MEKIYNKLVRDNIPDIIRSDNEKPVTRILTDAEYERELYRKLAEECKEVYRAEDNDEACKELADVLEVIRAIANVKGKSLEDIIKLADDKRNKRGVPFIIHHANPYQRYYEEDILEYRNDIVGHYRVS